MPPRKPTPRKRPAQTKATTKSKSTAKPTSKPKPKAKPKPAPKSRTIPVTLTGSLLTKFLDAAKAAKLSREVYGELMIDNGVSPVQLTDAAKRHAAVKALAKLIASLPAVHGHVAHNSADEWHWWVKFTIDTKHDLAWHIIQRLGWILNYYSLDSRYFTKFVPVSPPPDLNGGPHEYLSWVIEATIRFYDPRPVTEALRDELPTNLKSAAAWKEFDND